MLEETYGDLLPLSTPLRPRLSQMSIPKPPYSYPCPQDPTWLLMVRPPSVSEAPRLDRWSRTLKLTNFAMDSIDHLKQNILDLSFRILRSEYEKLIVVEFLGFWDRLIILFLSYQTCHSALAQLAALAQLEINSNDPYDSYEPLMFRAQWTGGMYAAGGGRDIGQPCGAV